MRRVVILLAALSAPALAGTVTVDFYWLDPADADFAHIEIFQAEAVAPATNHTYPTSPILIVPKGVGTGSTTVPDGRYWWRARARDTSGNASAWTPEIMRDLDATPPAAPGGWSVTTRVVTARATVVLGQEYAQGTKGAAYAEAAAERLEMVGKPDKVSRQYVAAAVMQGKRALAETATVSRATRVFHVDESGVFWPFGDWLAHRTGWVADARAHLHPYWVEAAER